MHTNGCLYVLILILIIHETFKNRTWGKNCIYPTLYPGAVCRHFNGRPRTTVVKGNINDPQGEPVIGASVIEKGTSNGVITDFNGNFSLNVTSPTATLLISYVGYVPQEVSANGTSPLKVVMVEDSKMLDEIVVIGYGVQRKGDVTSSVASVKAESFNKGMSQDIGQLIQGKVAGLSISLTSGDPTASTQMLLRGRSTSTARIPIHSLLSMGFPVTSEWYLPRILKVLMC